MFKLGIGFGVLTLLGVSVGLIGLNGIGRQRKVLMDFNDNILPNTRALFQIEVAATWIDDGENFLVVKGADPQARADAFASFGGYREQIDQAIRVYDHTRFINDSDMALWRQFKALLGKWWAAHLDFEKMVRAWDKDPSNDALYAAAAHQAIAVTTGLLDDAMNVLHGELAVYTAGSDQEVSDSLYMTRQVTAMTVGSIAVGAVIAFLLSVLISLGITRPLVKLRDAVAKVAEGRLEQNVSVDQNDEVGQLAYSFNTMAAHLRNTFQALTTSEERFRVLVEHAPEAILVFDVDQMRIIDANSNAQKLTGRGLAELRNTLVMELFSASQPDGRAAAESMAEHLQQVLDGETSVCERRIVTGQGSVRTCEVRLARLPSTGSRLLRVSCIDVTDRKRTEEALRTLSLAIEQSPSLIVITDPEWTIEYVNSRFVQVTGFSAEEVVGKKPSLLQSGVTPGHTYRDLSQAIESGKRWQGEFVNGRKTAISIGRERPLLRSSMRKVPSPISLP